MLNVWKNTLSVNHSQHSQHEYWIDQFNPIWSYMCKSSLSYKFTHQGSVTKSSVKWKGICQNFSWWHDFYSIPLTVHFSCTKYTWLNQSTGFLPGILVMKLVFVYSVLYTWLCVCVLVCWKTEVFDLIGCCHSIYLALTC